MKIIMQALCFCSLFLMTMSVSGQKAQDDKYQTVTLIVAGVCDNCKERIETASYDVSGVKKATWDLETGILTAVINDKKTSRQKIADAIAKVGYRSELAEADPEAYQNLPACCQYDSGIEKH